MASGGEQTFAAIIPWVRRSPVPELTANLEEVLRQHPEISEARIAWRPHSVNDFRPLYVPAIAERLVRWDTRHPDEVFASGFEPRADGEWVHDQMDLWTYVQTNVPSIFVGTARYYRDDAGRATRWMPRNRQSTFEYEVLAPGGLDVNLCLGLDHRFANQREIAFPGGIRREFIRSAREYDDGGHVVRLWENGFFLESFEYIPILDLIADAPAGPGVEDVYWTGPDDHHHLLAAKRYDSTAAGDGYVDDPMHRPGEPTVDSSLQGPAYPVMQPRAAFQRPESGNTDQVVFFTANQFLRMRMNTNDTSAVQLLFGPKNTPRGFPSLLAAGFAKVDAVLPVRGSDTSEVFYFFSQGRYTVDRHDDDDAGSTSSGSAPGSVDTSQCACFTRRTARFLPACCAALRHTPMYPLRSRKRLSPIKARKGVGTCSGGQVGIRTGGGGQARSSLSGGPRNISEDWPSLRAAGFSRVDAVLPNPSDRSQAYFFSGKRYALIHVIGAPGHDSLVSGPSLITDGWPSLRTASFTTLDVVFPNPQDNRQAYFFSGDNYVLVMLKTAAAGEYIINGPKRVADDWPVLREIAFYR